MECRANSQHCRSVGGHTQCRRLLVVPKRATHVVLHELRAEPGRYAYRCGASVRRIRFHRNRTVTPATQAEAFAVVFRSGSAAASTSAEAPLPWGATARGLSAGRRRAFPPMLVPPRPQVRHGCGVTRDSHRCCRGGPGGPEHPLSANAQRTGLAYPLQAERVFRGGPLRILKSLVGNIGCTAPAHDREATLFPLRDPWEASRWRASNARDRVGEQFACAASGATVIITAMTTAIIGT